MPGQRIAAVAAADVAVAVVARCTRQQQQSLSDTQRLQGVQGAAVCGSPSLSLSLSGQEVRLINVSGPYRVGNPAANKTRKGRRKGRGEGVSREARQDNTRA